MFIEKLVVNGYEALKEYLSYHVLTCLIPAFLIAGAFSTFLRREVVLKYFGRGFISYTFSAISGIILTVCSCTVIPLFTGLYRVGARIGPLFTFLYSAPAINLLAIVYTMKVIGLEIGILRGFFAILMSLIIGIIISIIFKSRENFSYEISGRISEGKYLLLIMLLILLLISNKYIILYIIILVLIIFYTYFKLNKDEIVNWLREVYILIRMIFPLILLGIFIAGVLRTFLTENIITKYVGSYTFESYLIASIIGSIFYFATLTEVPIVDTLMDLGMSKGSALAMLLSGPAVSLPNMIAIARIIGIKKSLTYILLVIIFSSISPYLYYNIISK